MKSKINAQSPMRNAQRRGVRSIAYCALFIVYCALFSCGPKVEETPEFYMEPVPRLTKYYPEVNANGDTTYPSLPVKTFINQHGDSFSTASLHGNIVVVQLFFASCQGICPVVSRSMEVVQKDFFRNKEVKLVSYSVDPARDSVPVLNAYSKALFADSTKWTFLTGDKKEIYDIIRNGYRLPDIEPGTGDEEDFIHSDQLVLIDREGIIRGYYSGTDTAQVNMLREDIQILISEK